MTERERAGEYRECHARSAFSFLRGASHPESLMERAAALELPAVALCDRDGFYGSVRAHQRAEEQGLRALVGAELTMEDERVVPVLVRTREGYRALSRLLSRMHLRVPKGEGRLLWSELEQVAPQLMVLSGDDEGVLERGWWRDGRRGMEAGLQDLLQVVPKENLWIEIQRHARRSEARFNAAKIDLAAAHGLPLLATNGVRYATAAERRVQDAFTCLHHHTHLDAAGRLLEANGERHLKTGLSMAGRFADLPEAILNTRRLEEQVEFSLQNLGYEFPRYPVPEGESMESVLVQRTWEGARRRYGRLTAPVRKQLQRELDLITRLGFSGYFLIVWDLIGFCREQGIMVQGRGSAANSAVCYSLGITPVDPVGSRLLFERFLSEGRKSWPDIDLDLPSGEQREQVIQEVYRKYGRHGAAMTANVITYRGRSAVREMGKVLDFPEEVLGCFSDLYGSGDFRHTLEFTDQVKQSGIQPDHPRARALARLYEQVYGLPRHLGQHSGGMVICENELDAVVPLENASMEGRSVVQWDKDDCEDMGMVKVDLLGLGMMAVIQESVQLSAARGRPIDLAQIPKDDAATYDLMCAAETIGVFQIESRAQMNTLRRMQPRSFYDVVIEVAIVRPGPIVGDLAHPYLERRDGRQPIDYIDERLKPTLERTLGVPLFQEQVLKMAMVMAGFDGSQAEELRRALSFHRSHERMQKVEGKLRAALEARGVEEHKIERIVKAIGSFALYGFPESHAISFGLLAYASAYLKVHRGEEFYAALLNNQPMGFYRPATLIQEAKRRGLRFLPPCILQSGWECHIDGSQNDAIRLGLLTIKGVKRHHALEALAQGQRRPFRSLTDFRARTRFDDPGLRALASAGALNALAGSRRKALWAVERGELEQGDLFFGQETASVSPLPEMSYQERLQADFRSTGMTTGRHPMCFARDALRAEGALTARELEQQPDGTRVTTAGTVICRQRPGTAKGVLFISLEDETGVSNSIVYADLFEQRRLVITTERFLRITGRIQQHRGSTHLMAQLIEPLDQTRTLPAGGSHDFH